MAVVAAAETFPTALGGNGAALALLVAWAIPDLRDARRGREIDGDLLGAAVFAVVLLLLPLAVEWADPLAGATGLVAGAALGYPLARLAGGAAAPTRARRMIRAQWSAPTPTRSSTRRSPR